MRNPSAPQPHHLGHVVELPDVTVFFGTRDSGEGDELAKAFPEFKLVQLNQTHSDKVAHSPKDSAFEPADAHYTRDRKHALLIRTADCMPVMIYEPGSGLIAAAHAGWRGIENEILIKTCRTLKDQGAELGRARAWIGPHILSSSFEVGRDVGARLEARLDAVRGFTSASTALLPHADSEKTYVDLFLIARAQLRSCGIEPERVSEIAIDTFTTPAYASFRREPQNTGRDISFIALK